MDPKYGIEKFYIHTCYEPPTNSDDNPIHQLHMELVGGDDEVYCESSYMKNLENIKALLEEQFK